MSGTHENKKRNHEQHLHYNWPGSRVRQSGKCAVQAQQPSPGEAFQRYDENGDGKVTRKEAAGAPWFDRMLTRLDRNGDGALQREEVNRSPRAENADNGSRKTPTDPSHQQHLDIRYRKIDGIDPKLLSLDLYVPEAQKTYP